jgi:hypothetical protein
VELRLQRRSADGARRVWTYAVPLAGGEATVLSTDGDDDDEQLEGRAPLAPGAGEEDMQPNAVTCEEAPASAPEAALQLEALQPAPARHALDDVDD